MLFCNHNLYKKVCGFFILQYCLMVHNNRMMALQGSLPNLCAAANIGHFATLPPLYPVSCAR